MRVWRRLKKWVWDGDSKPWPPDAPITLVRFTPWPRKAWKWFKRESAAPGATLGLLVAIVAILISLWLGLR